MHLWLYFCHKSGRSLWRNILTHVIDGLVGVVKVGAMAGPGRISWWGHAHKEDWNEDVHDHDDREDVLGDEPVDNEEAEEDDEGHGEEDGAVVNIFAQSKLADQLRVLVINSIIQH